MIYTSFLGPKRAIFGVRVKFKSVLGSTHVDEHVLLSMLSLAMTFDFDLIFWVVFDFLGL